MSFYSGNRQPEKHNTGYSVFSDSFKKPKYLIKKEILGEGVDEYYANLGFYKDL